MKEEEERRIREHMNRNNISIGSDNLSFAYNLGKEMQRSEHTILELIKQVSNLTNRLDVLEKTKTVKDTESRIDEDYKSFEGIKVEEDIEKEEEHIEPVDESVPEKEEEKEEEKEDVFLVDPKKVKYIKEESKEHKVLKVINENPNCCTHVITNNTGIHIQYVSVITNKLLKKNRIIKSSKEGCDAWSNSHDKYTIAAPIDYMTYVGSNNSKKKNKSSTPAGIMRTNTAVGRVLKVISDSGKEGVCAHMIANELKIDKKVAARSASYWVKRGRVTPSSEQNVCPDSRRMHNFYVATIEITKDSFVDIKEEEYKRRTEKFKEEQDKINKRMSKNTEELDLDTYDESSNYKYRDILQSINDHKKEYDMQYTSFIGTNAIREGFDKNWKNLEKALDRLEQDDLVMRKTTHGFGYSSWRLTQHGYKKLMGYNTEMSVDDERRDKESKDALGI